MLAATAKGCPLSQQVGEDEGGQRKHSLARLHPWPKAQVAL